MTPAAPRNAPSSAVASSRLNAQTAPSTKNSARAVEAASSAMKGLGVTRRQKAPHAVRSQPKTAMTRKAPSAKRISGRDCTPCRIMRSTCPSVGVTRVETDRSRSISFSTVTTPLMRAAIASARAAASAVAVSPVSVTTPEATVASTWSSVSISLKISVIRALISASLAPGGAVSIIGSGSAGAVSCACKGDVLRARQVAKNRRVL